ncbi:MAG: HPr family phosphocarrier protein [Candidatus Nanoarchaeia archaeon]
MGGNNKSNSIVAVQEIKNRLGLHARPAAMFVQKASNFKSEILVEKDGDVVNGKSLMGLLMLAAGCGSTIKITITGEDAQDALAEISKLLENKFDEE